MIRPSSKKTPIGRIRPVQKQVPAKQRATRYV